MTTKEKMMQRGITLVALVVTIIVLLILAGVTIGMATSGSGIFGRAKNGADTYRASVKEENKAINSYADSLDEAADLSNPLYAGNIADIADKSTVYGKEVKGYTCANDAAVKKWRLFYADGSNIYIIADDYIDKAYCPNGKNGTAIGGTGAKVSMENIIKDYPDGLKDAKYSQFNSDFMKYLKDNNKIGNEEATFKATAYMLDTDVWSKFKGDNAEYAIAGPTLELVLKAYKDIHKVNYKARTNQWGHGYEVSSDGTTYANYLNDMFTRDDRSFVVDDTSKAGGALLASPSACTDDLMQIRYYGAIDHMSYKNTSSDGDSYLYGFRPVVKLNSNVQLARDTDGNFKIIK